MRRSRPHSGVPAGGRKTLDGSRRRVGAEEEDAAIVEGGKGRRREMGGWSILFFAKKSTIAALAYLCCSILVVGLFSQLLKGVLVAGSFSQLCWLLSELCPGPALEVVDCHGAMRDLERESSVAVSGMRKTFKQLL